MLIDPDKIPVASRVLPVAIFNCVFDPFIWVTLWSHDTHLSHCAPTMA